MNPALSLLSQRGEIERLSLQFAQFIEAKSAADESGLVVAIAAMLSQQALQGSVCIKLESLPDEDWFRELVKVESTADLSRIDDINYWRDLLLASALVGCAGEETPLIVDINRIYLNRYWLYEHSIAEEIIKRGQSAFDLPEQILEKLLLHLFPKEQDKDQRNAAEKAANNRFSVISGGPGTGKTTTVVKILSMLINLDPDTRIGLAAPTGKAAARMMQSIQQNLAQFDTQLRGLPTEAFTLHRLLGYRRGAFEYHREHRLPFDCIVVDEASMIDIALMFRLLDACNDNCRIILLGDRDQLASVAAGNVLGDITGHGLPLDQNTSTMQNCIALLQRSRRFSGDSGIAALATAINSGAASETVKLLNQQLPDVCAVFQSGDQPATELLQQVIEHYELVVQSTNPEQALERFDQFRVLCASNLGNCGVRQLNELINQRLSGKASISNGELYQGQAIMVTENDRETRLFNGDTGVI